MPRLYCERCDRYFNRWNDLNRHKRDSPSHWLCYSCDIDFETEEDLTDHLIYSSDHFYCWICDEEFDSEWDLETHFDSDAEDPDHWYCGDCKRFFDSASNYDAHMRSATHQPRDVYCLFDECTMGFVSRGALLLHLEYGSCPSGIDQDEIDQIVRSYDRKLIVVDGDGDYQCLECERTCQALSGLCQHIESNSCDAGERSDIERTMKGIMRRLENFGYA